MKRGIDSNMNKERKNFFEWKNDDGKRIKD
jgi:hypothetical protein